MKRASLDRPVACFLLGAALESLRHEDEGAVLLLRMPGVRVEDQQQQQRSGRGHGFSLSIKSPDVVTKLGTTASLGHCKALTKAGGACPSLVDRTQAEYCLFHIGSVAQQYRTVRQELSVSRLHHRGQLGCGRPLRLILSASGASLAV